MGDRDGPVFFPEHKTGVSRLDHSRSPPKVAAKWLYMDSSRIGRGDSDGTDERCDCGCISGLEFEE